MSQQHACMELERGAKHHVTYGPAMRTTRMSTLHISCTAYPHPLLTRCHDFSVNYFQIPECYMDLQYRVQRSEKWRVS